MRCHYACRSDEHDISRRNFLQGAVAAGAGAGAVGTLGFSRMVSAEGVKQLGSQQKQVAVFWLHGGVSQLETFDPKPGVDTGGPFDAIPTSVPGVHVCELLPYTAQQMHHLSIVRSLNTKENNHGKGRYIMETGRRETPGFEFPYLGSAFSALLSPPGSPLPGYINLGSGSNAKEAAFLGPRHVPVSLTGGKAPANLELPEHVSVDRDLQRRQLRSQIAARFSERRRSAETEVYNESFDQAKALMERRDIFDFSTFSAEDEVRYGTHEFGRHCLMARKLLENGIPFVKVFHRNYDTHAENFNFHIEQLGEFDRPFASFMADLADRGMLEHTLVIVMCEFGRTPKINARMGRDHWSKCWSIALGGCGIQPGAVVGKTNDRGTEVVDREVDAGHLFHTYYRAVGLDPKDDWWTNGRPIEKADPKTEAIEELLA